MSRCRRCQLPEGKFNVTLNNEGYCNLCIHWERHSETYSDFDNFKIPFEQRIQDARGRYPYDALVGISGGKDSTYILYKLIHEYKLNVLAVTYDNGFLNNYAYEGIENVVATLGVDHFFHRPDPQLHQRAYQAAIITYGDPCIGCAGFGTFTLSKLCYEKKIPFFIHGRTPIQMFRNFYEGTQDISIPMIDNSMQPYSFDNAYSLHKKLDQVARTWLTQMFPEESEREQIYKEFFLSPNDINEGPVPEHLALFMNFHYDEEQIKSILEKEVGFKRPKNDMVLGHGDCRIHRAAVFMFEQIHQINPVLPEVATMQRRGLINNEEAQELLNKHANDPTDLGESFHALSKKVGYDRNRINKIIGKLRESGISKFSAH